MSSVMSCVGIQGFEGEECNRSAQLTFPLFDNAKSYRINWDAAVIYLLPQLSFHKNRTQILTMMQRE
jgi:hypothetical protein